MVDLEGDLEAVGSGGAVPEDPAGVVGQHVDPCRAGGLGELTGQSAHLVQPREVRHEGLRPRRSGHSSGLVRGAADDQQAMTLLGQLSRGRRADAVGSPGDHHGARPGRR